MVIWTTTPWTLPANEAVALRADYRIRAGGVQRDGAARRVVLAEGLAQRLPRALRRQQCSRELARFEGRALEGLKLQHPFQERQVPVILGDHVTLEAGTGAVHTAPAHGQDDYIVGTPLQPARGEPGAG